MVSMTQICIPVPTLEGIGELLSTVWQGTINAAKKHPYLTGLALVFWSYYPKFPFQVVFYPFKTLFVGVRWCFGFGRTGIRGASHASRYQSEHYGGYTPKDSLFARFQSYGATSESSLFEDNEESSFLWSLFGWGLFLAGGSILLIGKGTQN
ncbi:hypothetical protein CPB84DRAFT_1496294 [Gymnopilus junonius]|uniref:Uncharacterized protein n=1 Tax=Gymnopilus junonius TaxID=109634 RepID=A0A9P5NWJ6_GYMJU|nr:hypothetical protein CPB84DRAFT_1496294 [Gymnopilus junonius]